MWEQSEKELHERLSSTPNAQDVEKALAYFKVSRNFHGLTKNGKSELVLESLKTVREETLSSEATRVGKLVELLKSHFGQENLSAASKLLWLTERNPFIIYDNRARVALQKNSRFKSKNYAEYCEVWREQFVKNELAIQAASSRLLQSGNPFKAECDRGVPVKFVTEHWFAERVFDIYLWEHGGP
jgi:hypothetical protein